MKKKLLWIWIPSVLIIAVAGFVFFNIKSWDIDLGDEKNEQYHGTVGNDVEKKTLLDYECYAENWSLIESPEYDSQGDIINCYDYNWYQKWKQISYYNNWKIRTIWIVESWNFTGYYENWKIFEEWHMFKDAFNSENNKKWFILTKDGKWIQYYENWNKEFEWTYKKWTAEWKWIYYYDNWKIKEQWDFKEWYRDGNWVYYYENWNIKQLWYHDNWYRTGNWRFYYENWNISGQWNYNNWNQEWFWEYYYENGDIREKWDYDEGKEIWNWVIYDNNWDAYIWIFKDWEILELKWNIEKNMDSIKEMHYFNDIWEIYIESLRNKFKYWKDIWMDEFLAMRDYFNTSYDLYFTDWGEEFFSHSYYYKIWRLLALYSMMNCWGDVSDQGTYLYNLGYPQIAQETYFKNCPKWCKYSDEEDVDFVCE